MKDEKKKKGDQSGVPEAQEKEKLSRREAMKRMAKGIALVGTLGITAVVTQGQDECTGGYVNFTPPVYHNLYSNGYYNVYTDYDNIYTNTYTNNFYSNIYTNHTDYSNFYTNFIPPTYYNW